MTSIHPVSPLGLDAGDPKQIADFLLGLGYKPGDVAATLVDYCEGDRTVADRIVAAVARTIR